MINYFERKYEEHKSKGQMVNDALKFIIGIFFEDRNVRKPTVKIIIYSSIFYTLFLLSLFMFFYKKIIFLPILILIFLVFILFPVKFFYYVKKRAIQCIVITNKITNKNSSYYDAQKYVNENKSTLKYFALYDMLVYYFKSTMAKGTEDHSLVSELGYSFYYYMLPKVLIEKLKIKSLFKISPSTVDHNKELLIGEYFREYIDFYKKIGAVILALLVYYLISIIPTVKNPVSYTFLFQPSFMMVYFTIIIGNILNFLIDYSKLSFFTILYNYLSNRNEINRETIQNIDMLISKHKDKFNR